MDKGLFIYKLQERGIRQKLLQTATLDERINEFLYLDSCTSVA